MKRPALALLSAILVTAGSEAKAAACTCEGLKSLQNELKLALILRDKHAAKAHDLREKYGAPPKDFAVNAARRDYEAFEAPPKKGEKPAPGSARDGLPRRRRGRRRRSNSYRAEHSCATTPPTTERRKAFRKQQNG